jgi:uncharacterized membrane protein YebE (DUF533 family)
MSDNEALSSLAFLYLTFSHATDGNLSMEEMRTLADKVKAWAPDADLATVGQIIQGAVASYKQVPADQRLDTARKHAASVATYSNATARTHIVADLEAIANADGNVDATERAFIDELKAQFSA